MILSLVLMPFAVEFSMQVQLETRTALNVTDQLKIDNEIDGQYEIMLAHLRYDAKENEIDSYYGFVERRQADRVAGPTRAWRSPRRCSTSRGS